MSDTPVLSPRPADTPPGDEPGYGGTDFARVAAIAFDTVRGKEFGETGPEPARIAAVAEEVPTDDECADGSPNVPTNDDRARTDDECATVSRSPSPSEATVSRSPDSSVDSERTLPPRTPPESTERTQSPEPVTPTERTQSPEPVTPTERSTTPGRTLSFEPIARRRTRSDTMAQNERPPAPKRSKATAGRRVIGAPSTSGDDAAA